jgi:hypothetical protein
MEEIRKKCNGQSGEDGNQYVRTKRIELRVSPAEFSRIKANGREAGFNNTAQYVRERAVRSGGIDSPILTKKALLACQYELNRIGNNINQIARRLNQGASPDDEMLLVLLQIQELAEQSLKEALQIATKGQTE